MNYNKVIVMPVCSRPDYTVQVLEGIKSCYGSEDYTVIICAEPGHPEVIDAINGVTGISKMIFYNDEILKTGGNIFKCLSIGFTLTDFVIVFEDDIVPSKDCLKYLEWGRDTYEKDQEVFAISAYNRMLVSPEHYYCVEKYPWFTCWGWGTWCDRWDYGLRSHWKTNAIDGNWTDQINNFIRGDRVQVRPLLSRTQNIGLNGSVHDIGEEEHINGQHTPWWVEYEDHDFKDGNYKIYEIGDYDG